jgi:hypothetical protein
LTDVIGQLLIWERALFCTIGVQGFGGTVYHTNPGLQGSSYADAHYEVLNFNDFFMGFVPLVSTLVSGGPNTNLIQGIALASNNDPASKVFFACYYYTTHLIVLNVFIAFIINGYTLRTEARNSGDGDDTVDGLDKSQRENLESLYATLPDEPGWLVHTSGRDGQEVLLRRMFQGEIDKATQQASAQQRAISEKRFSTDTGSDPAKGGGPLGRKASRAREGNKSGKARAGRDAQE